MKTLLLFLKSIFTIFLLVAFFVTSVSALSADCAIKDGMSEELTEYIRVTERLLERIGKEASTKQCNANVNGENSASATVNNAKSTIVGSMNESIGFSNFSTSGRFYVDMTLKSEIPPGITRDHERLGKQTEHITNLIELVHSRCAENTVLETNISEDPVYSTSLKSLGTVLTEMLKNQVDMMNFYRETALWDATEGKYTFILVGNPKTFVTKMREHYGPDAISSCNSQSDFFKSITEAFGRITSLGGGIQKGMGEWRSAMDLLRSNNSNPERAETERNVLRNEVSSQGISTKGSKVIMNNLAKYDGENKHEGLSGFVSSIGERVYSSIDQFSETYSGLKDNLKKARNTDEYMRTASVIATIKTGINDEIIKDYENAKSLIGPENLSADTTVAHLIDTHILLEATNTYLQPYIKVSEQTCDAQAKGKGNCQFKNSPL